MDTFATGVNRLDEAVLKLVEAANAIPDDGCRENAIAVARHAREIQAAYASIRTQHAEGFYNRRRALERIIEDDGAIRYMLLKYDGEKIVAATNKVEESRATITSAMAGLKDGFSALAGKANLKKYPSKYDESENQ